MHTHARLKTPPTLCSLHIVILHVLGQVDDQIHVPNLNTKGKKRKRKRKTTRQNQNKPKRTTQHGQCSMEERREACSLQLRGKKKGTRRAHHASLARAELRQELVPLPDTRLRLCRQVIDCKCSILSLPHLIPNILHASFNAISHPVCVLCCVQCVGLASCFRCCPNLWT